MMSQIKDWANEIEPWKPIYFDCACWSSEHTLRFLWDDEDGELSTEVYLNQYRRWWKRVIVAIKYVFGYKSRYGHWDCFVLRKEDAPRLRALLDKVADSTKGAK